MSIIFINKSYHNQCRWVIVNYFRHNPNSELMIKQRHFFCCFNDVKIMRQLLTFLIVLKDAPVRSAHAQNKITWVGVSETGLSYEHGVVVWKL